jgi:hypothetical protein
MAGVSTQARVLTLWSGHRAVWASGPRLGVPHDCFASDFLGEDDFVQECASPTAGVLLLACTVGDDDDNPRSRVVLIRDGGWLDFAVSGDAFVSIDAYADGRAFVLGGESGTVIQFDWRATAQAQLRASCRILRNDMVDDFGPLRRLRIVGEDVFTVGTGGQVYRLRGDVFNPLPQLALDGNELCAKDVSGTGYGDLIVVTTDGFAALFDGARWQIPDLPICRLPDGRYAVAGYLSTVLIGVGDQWQAITPFPDDRNYYGVAQATNTSPSAILEDRQRRRQRSHQSLRDGDVRKALAPEAPRLRGFGA